MKFTYPFISRQISILLFFITVNSIDAIAQEFKLFGTNEPLEIILETDMKKLLRTKKEGQYQEAVIRVNGNTYPIRIKARGNYRRENCYFPPVTLNFSQTKFENEELEQLKKLKLVNACKMQKSYEQYILREYMIYRTFNLFTDKSFRVRLLKIDYEDSMGKMKTVSRWGFVIEDQYMMAKRNNGIIMKQEGLNDKLTNRDHMVMLSIFHFMIGNTDWQVARLHNLRLLRISDISESAPYVIPYDFDYTGMVNASYAIPSPVLGIETLRERLYWGKCYTKEELEKAIDGFKEKKDEIFSLYENFDLFSKTSKNEALDYLKSFYKIIENEKQWTYYFMDKCKG